MDPSLSLISTHEVFATLDKTELFSLSKILEDVTFQEGEVIFDTSQSPRFLYFIKQGSLQLKLANNESKTLLPGQLFGEIGLLNANFRTGIVTALETTQLIKVCGTDLFRADIIPAKVALKIVRTLSKRITTYLRTKEQISTKEIIDFGESSYVEFKSTLRWNLHTQTKDKRMEKVVLKTIAAFLNSNGGTLLIGVADDGKILGLDNDQFINHDKLLLHLTALIKDRIGALYLKFLHFTLEQIENKSILRVDCVPSTIPAYINDGQRDYFYIRTGPSTTDMRLSKVYDYIKERFYK